MFLLHLCINGEPERYRTHNYKSRCFSCAGHNCFLLEKATPRINTKGKLSYELQV